MPRREPSHGRTIIAPQRTIIQGKLPPEHFEIDEIAPRTIRRRGSPQIVVAVIVGAMLVSALGLTIFLRSEGTNFADFIPSISQPDTSSVRRGLTPTPSAETTDVGSTPEAPAPNYDDSDLLDIPADPFFDMAASAVIPLLGDPVILNQDTVVSRSARLNRLVLQDNTVPGLLGDGNGTASIYLLESEMLTDTDTLMARAPGSEIDFRFANFGGGDDELLSTADEGLMPDPPVAGTQEMWARIQPPNNTLNVFLTERKIGQGPAQIELFRQIDDKTTILAILEKAGFDAGHASAIGEFVENAFQVTDLLAGDQLAVRGVRLPDRIDKIGDYYRPTQLSLYRDGLYIGTAALSTSISEPGYLVGADPWFGIDLNVMTGVTQHQTDNTTERRLIDGLYATGLRNSVPTTIIGEAISYLSGETKLQRTIERGERMSLVFTDQSRDPARGGGRVLFVGVRRGDRWSVRCYVLKRSGNRGFACVNEGGQVTQSGQMVVPVKGVLTSKFGMRFHPIRKTQRLHAGVDWAAPTGTPIRAAFSGKMIYRAVRGGYGNFITLQHKDGITTRYAHLNRYAANAQLGDTVNAGDLIGYVGSTGMSTGPHLHFEVRRDGSPLDPLSFTMDTSTNTNDQHVSPETLERLKQIVDEIHTP